MRFVDISGLAFLKLIKDKELLDLLDIPEPRDVKTIRKHILNEAYPTDLIESDISRLCVYEITSSTKSRNSLETCYLEFDIYVHKRINQADKRASLIANKINKLFNEQYLDGYKLSYFHRMASPKTSSEDWVKYGVIFRYDNIVI